MDLKYLELLSKEYPNVDSVASEMINLSAIRSLPKGTEYFFSDLHGEYESFLHMLKSASGMIKRKIDLTFAKTVSSEKREMLAQLIYYPEKEIKRLEIKGDITDEWKRTATRIRSKLLKGLPFSTCSTLKKKKAIAIICL